MRSKVFLTMAEAVVDIPDGATIRWIRSGNAI